MPRIFSQYGKNDHISFTWIYRESCCWTPGVTTFNVYCIALSKCMPRTMMRMSPAYPMGWHPWSVSRCNSSFNTRLHSREDSTPPCGHLEVTTPWRVVFPIVIVMFLLPSIWQIQSNTAMGTPCIVIAVLITSLDVWLKAPSISIKVPIANLFRFSWSSIRFTALFRAVSVERPSL